jgi:hypothetical protein
VPFKKSRKLRIAVKKLGSKDLDSGRWLYFIVDLAIWESSVSQICMISIRMRGFVGWASCLDLIFIFWWLLNLYISF